MQIFSTPDSAAYGKPSVCALLETLIATAISGFVAIHYQTLVHVAVGACVAPFLLLRTPESVALGLRWFSQIVPGGTVNDVWWQIGMLLRTLALSICIRVIATIRYGFKGIPAMPRNWVQVVLCTDMKSGVEFVPGSGLIQDTCKKFTSSHDDYDDVIMDGLYFFLIISFAIGVPILAMIGFFGRIPTIALMFKNPIFVVYCIFMWSMIALLSANVFVIYFAASLYRFCLKTTALIWIPLIYVAYSAYHQKLSLHGQLGEIRYSPLWKIVRGVAWVSLLLFCFKLLILPLIIDWWNNQDWARVINIYVMPNIIHPWHIAATLNGLITLLTHYYFFDRAPIRLNEGVWSDRFVVIGLQTFTFVRGIISIYTISVGIWLTVVAAMSMKWPEWSSDFLPG